MKIQPKFKPGDRVIYTNPQGICFGEVEIVDMEVNPIRGITYRWKPNSAPWFATEESEFSFLHEGKPENFVCFYSRECEVTFP